MGDFEVFRPKGSLSYNQETEQYEIKNSEKAQGNSYKGEVFTYNENTNQVTFEGPIHFTEGNDPGVKVEASALGTGNLDSGKFVLDAFLMLDFEIPEQAARMMAQDIDKSADQAGAPPATQDRTALLYKAAGRDAAPTKFQAGRAVASLSTFARSAPSKSKTCPASRPRQYLRAA
jgi:hypothetical protein